MSHVEYYIVSEYARPAFNFLLYKIRTTYHFLFFIYLIKGMYAALKQLINPGAFK